MSTSRKHLTVCRGLGCGVPRGFWAKNHETAVSVIQSGPKSDTSVLILR